MEAKKLSKEKLEEVKKAISQANAKRAEEKKQKQLLEKRIQEITEFGVRIDNRYFASDLKFAVEHGISLPLRNIQAVLTALAENKISATPETIKMLLFTRSLGLDLGHCFAQLDDCVAGGVIPEEMLKYRISKDSRKILSGVVVAAVLDKKISEDLFEFLLQGKKITFVSPSDYSPVVKACLSGQLSLFILEYLIDNNACFTGEDWMTMYESGIDFLVQAYLREFYPEIEVDF